MANIRQLTDFNTQRGQGAPRQNQYSTYAGGARSGLELDHNDNDQNGTNNNSSSRSEMNQPVMITVYRNGFQIEDGEFRSFSKSENKATMDRIRAGDAPPELAHYANSQGELAVGIQEKNNEDFVESVDKTSASPVLFAGEGNSLGSKNQTIKKTETSGKETETSGEQTSGEETSGKVEIKGQPSLGVDEEVVNVLVRFYDGSRHHLRFGLGHTVNDLKKVVRQSTPHEVNYDLFSTYPNRRLDDNDLTLTAAQLNNSTVMQKIV